MYNFRKKSHEANQFKNQSQMIGYQEVTPPPQKSCQTKNIMYKFLGIFLAGWLLLFSSCSSSEGGKDEVEALKKGNAKDFSFTLLKITDVKEISVEKLKKQLKSDGDGWTIKSIKIDDESFAEVKGNLPDLKIILKKSGSFTASITLQKKGWQDFVLKDCKIQVVLPKFSFSKFTQNKSKKTITSAEILKQIAGAEAAGYSIKSIVVSDKNFAKVSGAAPKLQIDIQKVGKFTATIVLSHKSFFEITLKDCAFEIVPEFIFSKLRRSISGSKTITAAEILGKIVGAGAAGYTIKSIAITEDANKLATANGTAITLDLTKTGVFKATIILKKDQHSDITLTDCAFEVSGKKAAPSLTFTKLSRKFSTAPITKTQILGQIKEDITGWTLKSVVLSNASFGDVDSNFSIRLKKIGNFSAKLTFERTGYVAAQVTGSFEITKGFAKSLKFAKLTVSSKGSKTITAARILGQIANVKTWGYGLKSIGKINNSDVASASGTQITIKKAGSFTTELILESANYEDARVQASFEVSGKNVAPVLSFAALKRNYSGSKTITKAQILNQITATSGQSDWAGYVLKSIVLTENASLVRVNNATFEITILKAGTFKAQLTFTKDTYVNALVTGTFEIGKVAAPSLKFNPISKKFGGSNTISKAEILGKIRGGDISNWTLESIVPSDNSFASVSAAFEMTLQRVGNFTATITLSRENYEDAVIQNCSFKIAIGDAPTDLRLTGFSRKFSDSRTITAAQILAKISGKKDGYVLKSISINSGSDVARVSGTKPTLQINIQKAGSFTADIVLEQANYEDATINNAGFTIEKGTAAKLTFDKITKPFGQKITAADILANVRGSGKTGYTLKSISIKSGNSVATVSANQKEITTQKAGNFMADLVLERVNYEDARINNAPFTITKIAKPSLTFDKLTKRSGETITAANILANVRGSGKTGYTLKRIAITSGSDVATVSGTKPALQIASKKAGTFKATLVLERTNYEDVTINDASFEITKRTAPSLTFPAMEKPNNDDTDNAFSTAQILANVQGKKDGYTVKSLELIGGDVKDVTPSSAIKRYKRVQFYRPATVTLDVTLENPSYDDVTLRGSFSFVNIFKFNVEGNEVIGYNDPKWKTRISVLNIPFRIYSKKITSIGRDAFKNNVTLTSVTLPWTVTTIGNEAFANAWKITSLSAPGATSIKWGALSGCLSLNTLSLNYNNLSDIENEAFRDCRDLVSFTSLGNVTSIAASAFEGCSKLSSIKIPSSVTVINYRAFKDCTKLVVTVEQTNPSNITLKPGKWSGGVWKDFFTGVKQIRVPSTSLSAYKGAREWSSYKDRMVAD